MERLFHTFQDRGIKEMRLAHVSTLNAANQFLDGYLPLYNRRVAVPPAQASDLHRPRPAHRELDRIRCLKTTTMPAPGLPHRAPGGTLPDSRYDPDPPWVGGRARGWDDADHAPGSAARRSRDHVLAREGRGSHTGSPLSASGQAEAESSVAPTPATGTENTGDGGEHLNRRFLLWEKEDIYKLG